MLCIPADPPEGCCRVSHSHTYVLSNGFLLILFMTIETLGTLKYNILSLTTCSLKPYVQIILLIGGLLTWIGTALNIVFVKVITDKELM